MRHTIYFPCLTAAVLTCLLPALAAGIDLKKTAVLLPFESAVKGAPGFPETTRTTIAAFLKDDGVFSQVLMSEQAGEQDKSSLLEIGASLTEFKAGNMATRMLVGVGSGRASATWVFTIKEAHSGKVVFQKTIKEKASFWSNNSSSSSQRQELPEKIAKALIKELRKGQSK